MKDKIISLSFFWLKVFDKHRLLFKALQPLNKYFRWFLYVSTNICFYFFISFLTRISINYIISYNFSPFVEETMISLLMFFKVLGIFFTLGFFSLEILMNFDLEKYQKEKEDKEIFIRTNKLEWWRLRNCNWFFRILFYTIIFLFLFLMILNSFLLSIQDQPLNFVAFETFSKQFLAGYVIIVMFFDYKFVQKARKKILDFKLKVGGK